MLDFKIKSTGSKYKIIIKGDDTDKLIGIISACFELGEEDMVDSDIIRVFGNIDVIEN